MNRSLGFGALALVLGVLLVRCGTSATSPTSPTPTPTPGGGGGGADVVLNIVGINGNMSFQPTPAIVHVGQTVAWHNSDATAHTATQDAGAWDTGALSPGSTSAPVKMTKAGSFSYHCNFHPVMVSTLTVQ
jgi:plastocyanin